MNIVILIYICIEVHTYEKYLEFLEKKSVLKYRYSFVSYRDMTSLSYGRIFCLEFQKIDGTYQRYNHYFEFFLLEFYFFLLKI